MSLGQAIGGIAGAVVGFFAGGNVWMGAQIGMSLGGYLDPPKGPTVEGPRLSDLSVQTSTYGASIPRVYGTCVLSGNVFWVENNGLKEVRTKKKSGGKGGPKTTTKTYAYYATFAVGLCEGEIAGVLRIWIGSNLIYNAGSTDPATIAASNAAATGFRVYTGSETQDADPRLQATLGVANTPAYRGLAYIVFDDLPLEKYGNSLLGAQVRVEVMQLGVTYTYPYQTFTMPSGNSWRKGAYDGTVYCTTAYFSHVVAVSTDGLSWQQYALPDSASVRFGVASDGGGVLLCYGGSPAGCIWRSVDHGVSWAQVLPVWVTVTDIKWNGAYFLATTDSGSFYTSANGLSWTAQTPPPGTYFSDTPVWHADSNHWYVVAQSGANPRVYRSPTAASGTWSLVHTTGGDLNNFSQGCVHKGRILYIGVGTGGSGYGAMMVWSDNGTAWNQTSVPLREYWILSDGDNAWVGDGGTVGSCYYSPDGVTGWTAYDGPDQGVNHIAFYANFRIVAVPAGNGQGFLINKQFSNPMDIDLGEIVSAECLRSGLLTAGDIDVAALTTPVHGYRIGNRGTLRSALEPLQIAYPFDVVQRGYKVTFIPRGGASVATIAANDLGAHGDGDESPVRITISREMDSQLPRRIAIQYLDSQRDHERGEQYAERGNTPATNIVAMEIPVVLDSTEAAGIAEVLLYLAWLERYELQFSLPAAAWNALEPADVVALPTDEGTASVRLIAIDYTSDGRLDCKARYNLPAIYTPTATGAPPASLPVHTIVPVGGTVYHLLDIPQVHDVQANPGFLAAMCGALDGWQGGALMQSADAGTTWSDVQDFDPPGATIGTAGTTIGSVDHRMIDKASVLTVTLANGDLYDVTEAAMLGGANHFAYGADGRWEIIAAQKCTLQSGKTYVLRDLLRGRFGSEWAMGLHQVGDAIVLLDTDDLAMVSMSASTIGLSRLYRGITYGRDLSTDSNRSFTYQAVNLKPLAPILLNGHRDASGNWSLSWVRRARGLVEWRDYVDTPLNEATEQYQIEIFSSSGYTTVKRTLTLSAAAASYTTAEQTADFGSNQATLYLRIYQLSATVGRGYPLQQSITR